MKKDKIININKISLMKLEEIIKKESEPKMSKRDKKIMYRLTKMFGVELVDDNDNVDDDDVIDIFNKDCFIDPRSAYVKINAIIESARLDGFEPVNIKMSLNGKELNLYGV